MIQKIFAVRDTKASVYGVPFYMPHEANAVRAFQTSVNDEATQLAHYPEDYELRLLGEYDDVTGKHTSLEHSIFIVSAAALVKIDYRKKLENDLRKAQEQSKDAESGENNGL